MEHCSQILSEWMFSEKLRYFQMISCGRSHYIVLNKEMVDVLFVHLVKNDVMELYNDKLTMVCLNCNRPFIHNNNVCECYRKIACYHNYHCLIDGNYFPNVEAVLNDLKIRLRATRRSQTRTTLEKEAGGDYVQKDIDVIYKLQAGLCYYCMAPIYKSGCDKFTVDHIEPLSSGGSNWPFNLALTCNGCNLKKSWTSEREFIKKVRRDKSMAWIDDHKEFMSFIKRQKMKEFASSYAMSLE